jgi:transcriptional regulator with XRE-family HTH domain
MAFSRARFIGAIGRRLIRLRKHLNYSLEEMARKLGLSKSGYYKNEGGLSFPGLETLDCLQRDYDISMDWLMFEKGPMHFQEKQPEPQPEPEPEKVEKKETLDLEELSPDVRELLEYMEGDRLLKHEVLVYFYRYKERKEHQGLKESPLAGDLPPDPAESSQD